VIKVGEKLPAGTLREFIEVATEGCSVGPNEVDVAAATAGKTIALFALPGAFTPTCSAQHVPGYRDHAEQLKAAGVDEILSSSDVVSVHVPLLDSTHHLINSERLAMMKKTSYIINTSRGPVIDESALVAALTSGAIAGAGLDVFEHEPALAEGLAECESAVLTPHIASASTETRSAMSTMAAESILATLGGGEPEHRVV